MSPELLARDFLRALRGQRSQPAFSRRLGYRTNVSYMWEAGRSAPTAAVTLDAARRVGIDVRAALERFYRVAPAWLQQVEDPCTPAAVAALLDDLRAGRSVASLARAAAMSRHALGRLMRGQTEPRLPEFFTLVECFSLRLLDFVAAFVDPERLPSARAAHRKLDGARRAAYDVPWSQAVLRVLELAEYRALPAHQPGFVSSRLGIDADQEQDILELLLQSGQVELRDGRYRPTGALTLDTRKEPDAARRLRQHWSEVGVARAADDPAAVLSFNLGTLSQDDLPRVHELHRRYFAELRELMARSEPSEIVLLANVQLVRLA